MTLRRRVAALERDLAPSTPCKREGWTGRHVWEWRGADPPPDDWPPAEELPPPCDCTRCKAGRCSGPLIIQPARPGELPPGRAWAID